MTKIIEGLCTSDRSFKSGILGMMERALISITFICLKDEISFDISVSIHVLLLGLLSVFVSTVNKADDILGGLGLKN